MLKAPGIVQMRLRGRLINPRGLREPAWLIKIWLHVETSQIRSLMPQIWLAHAPCPHWLKPGLSQTAKTEGGPPGFEASLMAMTGWTAREHLTSERLQAVKEP